ncbi:MAG: phosphopantothenoylcysteine decarboxylase [Planctomycetes bacterium]|jgi:phosphopantothenoylcysteine decarboxylase/phosphopantothenate--cysteine ligase|nr:phosphopantothenoylcysteine decarboxylase [Planctomycetota bacterium]
MSAEVLLGIGGGIAAYKLAFLCSRLVQRGARVRVAMTARATDYIGALTFEGLSGQRAILSSTQIDADGTAPHIEAARRAQVYVIAPATAGLLARLAQGAADDPVTLLALTCRCPILLCPAMNDAMWLSPAVQHNTAVLRARGLHVLGPVSGHLAEGYDAIGRMVEPDTILERALQLAAAAP